MVKPIWRQKEDLAREWCSQRNNNIKLIKDNIIFWDADMHMYGFEFDIASRRRRKEIDEVESEIKQYKEKHGKITFENELFMKLFSLCGISSGEVDHREVIGMVKATKYNGVAYEAILGDCFLLARASADKKYMILTDKKMYDHFNRRCKAILHEIELGDYAK